MRFGRVTGTAAGLIALGTVFATWVPAWAQVGGGAAAAKQSGTATIQVYTRETVVDVTVTDKNGKPVHGLTRANFSITEDDKSQSIRSFKEFSKDTPVTASAPRKLPPNTYTNAETATGPLNVFLLDDINDSKHIMGTSCEAETFIKKSMTPGIKSSMAAGTQVALLALGDRLTVLESPTTDPAQMLKTLNTLCTDPFQHFVKSFGAMEDPCGVQNAANWATLHQLSQLATYLSGVRGKKNLIWFDSGVSSIIFPDSSKRLCLQDFSLALRKTYDLLEDAQVTVSPLDPLGVRPLGNGQLAMEAVAEATGGVAYYERNDLDMLMAKAVRDGSSYYTLSYAPPSVEYDGKYHAISIKVDRPGVHLLYRKGYSSEDPALLAHLPETFLGRVTRDTRSTGPAVDPLAAALSPIAPPATQLLFDVRVEPSMDPENPFDPPVFGALDPKFKKAPLTRYGLLFAVPQSQIAFADAGGGTYSGSLKFDVAAFDSDGKMVTSRSQTQTLPLTNKEYQQFIATPFQLYQQLDLPPGEFTLRVGVLDGVSNKLGTVQISLTVGKATAASKIGGTAQR